MQKYIDISGEFCYHLAFYILPFRLTNARIDKTCRIWSPLFEEVKSVPNKKSAKKHMRADERKRLRNFSIKSSVKTAIKKAEQSFRSGDSGQAEAALREALSKLDKAHQKGVLKENTANRRKSRLAKKFNQTMAA